MRKQNHFRKSPNGLYAWDVHRLIELSKDLAIENVPLSNIKELDEAYWFDCPGDNPTGRVIVGHMRLVMAADLSYPIILCADGGLMDGMHRVAKALLQGEQTIKAVRFLETPKPDHTDITPQGLP